MDAESSFRSIFSEGSHPASWRKDETETLRKSPLPQPHPAAKSREIKASCAEHQFPAVKEGITAPCESIPNRVLQEIGVRIGKLIEFGRHATRSQTFL